MNRGFTLIEILVSITIMVLFMGVGVTSYLSFNDRQQIAESAKNVQNLMRSAEDRASAGDSPPGCVHLISYRVTLTSGSSDVTLNAICNTDTVPNVAFLVSTYTMQPPTRVVAANNATFDFKVLQGGVQAGNVTLKTTATVPVYQYQFAVSAGGSISDGDFL